MTETRTLGQETDAERKRALERMRLMALGLLGLMAVVFVAASLARARWPWLGYVRAFAEAGMVGGLADWFAVSALFRRPLGLPIPHTAIIPRNKDRIGEALGRFIADNFLTELVLDTKLKQLELARWGGDWLSSPENARRLAARLAVVLPGALESLPPGMLAELAGSAARGALRVTPAAPVAATVLDALWRDGRVQPLLDRGLHRFAAFVAGQQEAIGDQVKAQTWRWLPRWVDRMLAAKISSGLAELLEAMRAPDHPWRQELSAAAVAFAGRLRAEPELQGRVEAIKLQLLSDLGRRRDGDDLFSGLEARLREGLPRGSAGLARSLERLLLSTGRWLAQDEAAQGRLNGWARLIASKVIAPRRHEIGRHVAQVVAGWDARDVADKLELQVGRDLQYIRITGALVGGLAGVAIYLVARLFGLG